MKIDYCSIGRRIQTRRKELHKTQEQTAEALSVTVGYISQIERGISKVNLETLAELAEFLDTDITEFISGTVRGAAEYLSEEMHSQFELLTPKNKKMLMEFIKVMQENQ